MKKIFINLYNNKTLIKNTQNFNYPKKNSISKWWYN